MSASNKNVLDDKKEPQPQQAPLETATDDEAIGLQTNRTYSAKFLADNGLELMNDENGRVTARPSIQEQPANRLQHRSGFNIVLTHCTADFDSLASAVGLAKLWSTNHTIPTYVVLPRGAHPSVARFLALHKHLFPIRSLKSLLNSEYIHRLHRVALVDAQRRDRLGPAEALLKYADYVMVVDHHVDQDSDIQANDYIVDNVGSVSTMIAEKLQSSNVQLSQAESTLLALGIHSDTGSLCFDSTSLRDAKALVYCMSQGASQTAIAEHAQSGLSPEQQGVLTQALMNANSTVAHGVTVSTVLLSADGFINGLAAVTQDALELSSSDIFLLGLVYHAKSGRSSKRKKRTARTTQKLVLANQTVREDAASILYAEAWKGGEEALRRRRLRKAFDRRDTDGSGYLEENEVALSLASAGVIAQPRTVRDLIDAIDTDGNGKIDFEEFVVFAREAETLQNEENSRMGRKGTTMIIIGRVKAGVSLKAVKLNKLLEQFGGGGHAKAASATVRLNSELEAEGILQSLVDELVDTSLRDQPTVGDFMTAPVLSVRDDMTVKQVEDLFTRYDVRALPVVDEDDEVIGLVSYSLVAAAKQRLWNKEKKRKHQEQEAKEKGKELPKINEKVAAERKKGTAVKGWMLQHIQIVEASRTMTEVETILLENDVGCIPVVADGTNRLVGMVTRTDVLRQHRYYPNLPYHNKGFVNSIEARKPIIELRKRLKKFDPD